MKIERRKWEKKINENSETAMKNVIQNSKLF